MIASYRDSEEPICTVNVDKMWFRKKNVFDRFLGYYERRLADIPAVRIPINAGNMIYEMMRKLRQGVDWDKQAALVASYRDLMYRMSYVDVMFRASDIEHLSLQGRRTDIMWALAFISQVYPDNIMSCQDCSENVDGDRQFAIKNGAYVGQNARIMQASSAALPDIWSVQVFSTNDSFSDEISIGVYDPNHVPQPRERFITPDGRAAEYVRMDSRFRYADTTGAQTPLTIKHNISASCIKDFEDLVSRQTDLTYDVYQMRYVALMNKVHELEARLHGLEISCYDMLPIGERGLPYASDDTITRTNRMDCNSLKYLRDKAASKNTFSVELLKDMTQQIGQSIMTRLYGYDVEYITYQSTGTPEVICRAMHEKQCSDLYEDFVAIELLEKFAFSRTTYAMLCNDPVRSTVDGDFEKQKRRIFGRGYAAYVALMYKKAKTDKKKNRYKVAFHKLLKMYPEAAQSKKGVFK